MSSNSCGTFFMFLSCGLNVRAKVQLFCRIATPLPDEFRAMSKVGLVVAAAFAQGVPDRIGAGVAQHFVADGAMEGVAVEQDGGGGVLRIVAVGAAHMPVGRVVFQKSGLDFVFRNKGEIDVLKLPVGGEGEVVPGGPVEAATGARTTGRQQGGGNDGRRPGDSFQAIRILHKANIQNFCKGCHFRPPILTEVRENLYICSLFTRQKENKNNL